MIVTSDALEKLQRDHIPQCDVLETSAPSPVATAIARELHQRHAIGSTVHWGNEGFCVDAALNHPEMPVDATVGVLTDFTRFRKTPDPIEWDLFRTNVLRGQGWQLMRLWSPVLFRRGEQIIERVAQEHHRAVNEVKPVNE